MKGERKRERQRGRERGEGKVRVWKKDNDINCNLSCTV